MCDCPTKAAARPASPRWTIFFAVATWVAAVGLVLIFALFWRMTYAPHGAWAIATTGAVLLAGALTVVCGAWQFVRGPRRALTAAVVLLGTTPIVWGATFLASLYLQAVGRESISINAPTRIAAFWFASLADVEARWRYSRQTQGRHVVLLDDGQTPDPQKLVVQMDEQIEQMAALLGAPPPDRPARWVRGPLLGERGRALISWAVCAVDNNDGELTSLDRHEVAHVVITMMGGADQYPPMLLAEGWAESQSSDRDSLITKLAKKREQDTYYSLQELTEPAWYGRSAGPVYTHGGPLVVYLMGHYGAEKFFSLYDGVCPATFPADCERILGDPWPLVEQEFWQWLATEADKIAAEHGTKNGAPNQTTDDVKLAESVDPKLWQAIVDGYRAARTDHPQLPDPCAFAVERNSTIPQADDGTQPGTYEETWQFVVDGERVWQLRSLQPQGRLEAVLANGDSSASYRVSEDNRVTRTRVGRDSHDARVDVRYEWNMFANLADLGYFLPVEPEPRFRGVFRITAIRPPTAPTESLWEVDCVQRLPDGEGDIACHLRIDASAEWCVESYRHTSAKERTENRSTLSTFFAHATAIESMLRTETDQGTWTMQLRLRELSPSLAQKVRDEVEAIARRGPTRDWGDLLLRPMTFAIAWPAVGLVLLGVALVRHGRGSGKPEEE